ncbi:MAG TPA: hypothetical protein ENN13_04375 [Candidatus Altiarchaeales archaeon]|nr:hypothetical protein [Candidatus Altiarchaeales archaeon]
MSLGVEALAGFIGDYASVLPAEIMAGNVFAISIALMIFYIIFYFINKLAELIVFFLKKIFLLTIVTVAFVQFLAAFGGKVGAEGFTNDTIIFGAAGIIAGVAAFVIAFYAAFSSLKDLHHERTSGEASLREKKVEKPVLSEKPEEKSFFDVLSVSKLKDEKNLGAVLTYLVIAEFGVFSSKTISAPNVSVGMGFFIVFMIAGLAFIHQSYRNYITGLRHLAVALVAGGILSIILGHFWAGFPLETLLSYGYFATDSLVALVTGIAVSLFMGSKN